MIAARALVAASVLLVAASTAAGQMQLDSIRFQPLITEPTTAVPGETHVLAGRFAPFVDTWVVPTKGGDNVLAELTSLTIAGVGPFVAWSDVSAVRMAVDHNHDGIADEVLGEGTFGHDSLVHFDFVDTPLDANDGPWITIEIDVADTAVPGSVLRFGGVGATTNGLIADTSGLRSRAIEVVREPAAIHASNLPVQVLVAPAGTVRAVAASLLLSATGDAVELGTLSVRAVGSAHDAIDLIAVGLVWDRDRSGAVSGLGEEGGDVLLDESVFLADDGVATLDCVRHPVAAGGGARLLITITVSAAAPPGAIFGVVVESVTAVTPVGVSGLPIAGHPLTLVEADAPDADDGIADSDLPATDTQLPDPYLPFGTRAGQGCTAGAGSAPAWWLLPLVAAICVRRYGARSVGC